MQSYANAILSSFEDPEKILEQSVLEMNDDLTKLRQATAQVLIRSILDFCFNKKYYSHADARNLFVSFFLFSSYFLFFVFFFSDNNTFIEENINN